MGALPLLNLHLICIDRGPWIWVVCQLGGELFHPKYGPTLFLVKILTEPTMHGGTYGSRTFGAVEFLNENSWVVSELPSVGKRGSGPV